MSYDPNPHSWGSEPRGQRPSQGHVYGHQYPQQQPPVVSGPPAQHYGVGWQQQAPELWQQSAPPPAPAKKARWPWLVLAAAVLVLGGGVYTAYDKNLIFKDSGIKACEGLRDGSKTVAGTDKASNQKMTEAQYRQARKVFEDSRYDDIRDHGTKLMDVVWQMSQTLDGKEEDQMGALIYLQPLTQQMTGLQSACADQGIIINLKPAGN
jgi:hypothetical protein